jgi:serine protease Do
LIDQAGDGDRPVEKREMNPQLPEPVGQLAGEMAPVERHEATKVAVPEPPPQRPPHALTTQEIVARSESSVALIKGRAGSGTGFLVRPGILATNAHVIANEPVRGLNVHFPSAPAEIRGPFSAQLQYKDARRDLALLSVATHQPALELSRSYVFKRGEDVTIIGSPGLGDVVLPNAVSRGVMSTEIQLEGQRFYQLGAAVNPGNSGGPAFNDLGQVIGIVTAKAAKQESIGFCIPVEDLASALNIAASSTPEQLVRIQRLHEVEAVLRRLHAAGQANSGALDAYVSSIGRANQLGDSPDFAIREIRGAIQERLIAMNRTLVDDIRPEIDELVGDLELSPQIRRDLRGLWDAFSQLRGSAENPQGAAVRFVRSVRQLQALFRDRIHRLGQALGVNLEE